MLAIIDAQVLAWLGAAGGVSLHVLGILHVIHALMHVRTSQGTIAWVVSLVTFPYLAVPLYWLLGRSRFHGYVRARKHEDEELGKLAAEMHRLVPSHEVGIAKHDAIARAAQYLGGLPFTDSNELTLLIDGEETFDAIFREIEKATDYVCLNFFIVKNDRIGVRLQQLLIRKSKEGVRIWF